LTLCKKRQALALRRLNWVFHSGVFTYWVDDELGHVVNPSLTLSEDTELGEEGCLSLPGLSFDTPRSRSVVAQGFNMYGDPIELIGSDLLARCVQHETDHLDGIISLIDWDPKNAKRP